MRYCKIEYREREPLLSLPQSSIPPGALFLHAEFPHATPPSHGAPKRVSMSWTLSNYALSEWRKKSKTGGILVYSQRFSCRIGTAEGATRSSISSRRATVSHLMTTAACGMIVP